MSSKSADKYVALDTRQVVLMIFLIPVVTSHPHCSQPGLCANGGTCVEDIQHTYCVCPNGFTGPTCADVDYCATAPCLNSATCTNAKSSFLCTCQPGYTGQRCETVVSACGSSPCVHGQCHDIGADFQCQCDAGFTGTYCDVDKDYCSSDPCRSKGTCVAEVTGGYSCHCQPDFLGLNCEQHVSGKCAENGESFCTCTVNGSPVKVSIPAPPSPHDGADSRDVIMGLVGLLVGWAVGSGAMTIYRCCCRGPCCLDGACVGAGRRGQGRWTGVRPASSASTVSSLDSLFGDSPTHGLTESSRPALSSAGSHDSKRPMNVYRAGFSDTILHQTARRKSAGTYASGHVDW